MAYDWVPKTKLGKSVMNGEITSLDKIFEQGYKITEPEIVEKLLPGLKTEIVFIGGSPGKGGGIKRTPTRRTARMHRSGRRYKISALVIAGNEDGYVGIGKAVGTENRIAIEKATKLAKINIIPVQRGCGSWECNCHGTHSIPFTTSGKSGSNPAGIARGTVACGNRYCRADKEKTGDGWPGFNCRQRKRGIEQENSRGS